MVTGRQIGGYQILEELGRGAMGVVFKARQVSMDRIVAIKFLPKRLAQDDRIVARFLREARAAGQLAHPNIVSVHELGMADGLHFIAMEYVDGNSIQKKIKEKGPYSERETLEIAIQIAEALKLAHSRGILHRDIKPDNFLIDSMGRVRLADLGLALIQSNTDGGLTQDGTTLGTPHFMSPEQCSGTGVDARSDLYSLGSSMFVMATGRTPYEGSTAASVMVKVLTEPPISLKKLNPDLSSGFIALVEKLMQKDPSKRFQNAASAAEAISQCKSGLYKAVPPAKPAVAPKPVAPAKPATEKQGTRAVKANDSKLFPLMIGAGAAVLILGVLFAASRGTPKTNETRPVATVAAVTLPKGAPAETHASPFAVLRPDEHTVRRTPDPEQGRHPQIMSQLRELGNDFRNGKLKPGEAKRKLVEFHREHDKKLMNNAIPRNQVNRLEIEIDAKLRIVTDEWKKLEPKIDADIKDARIGDALAKLSEFHAANEATDEANRALDRIDALCSGVLASADKLSVSGNSRDALALVRSIGVKLPEKQDAAFKAAIARYEDGLKLTQELADVYDRAWRKALYYDPVAKTCFQFTDAAKFCVENVSKLKYDANRKDLAELSELFKAADKIVASLRKQLSVKPVEMPSLSGYSNVTVTAWDDRGLSFVSQQFPQAQLFTWEQASSPDVVLQVAKKLREADLDKSTGQWDLGVLAFAMGNQAAAGKFIRDAVAKENSPFKTQAEVALKVLKPLDAPPVAIKVDKPEVPVPAAGNLEDDAKLLFKDLQDAVKAGDKKKFDLIRADFDSKFAGTEFVKTRKKEIDELALPAKPAVVEPPKPAEKKVDTMSPEETAARNMLKSLGWTDIVGTWVWKKNAFYVEEFGELSNPALEGDINVSYQIEDKSAQLRILTRTEKLPADRFVSFGTVKGVGYGLDANHDRAWVYLDYKTKEPAKYYDFKFEPRNTSHTVNVSHSVKGIVVTVDGVVKKSMGGDGRQTGDMRVIVNGPVYLVPKFTAGK